MDFDRETLVELGVAAVPVAVLFASLVVIGLTFAEDRTLSPTGGKAMVGAIVLFVLLFTATGYWFARSDY